MKVVLGLGNPGRRYEETRHNVGWWVLDRLAYDWRFGSFQEDGSAWVASGEVDRNAVLLVKPAVFMNRSGLALRPFVGREGFDVSRDLLVVTDDAALDVGRVRFRPRGGAGGHNGLRSVQAVLESQVYARLRVGVGRPPPDRDLVEWVLSPMDAFDEDKIVELLPELTEAVGTWLNEGTEATMNRFNR